jgi:uncharacterized protein (DUF427 family)
MFSGISNLEEDPVMSETVAGSRAASERRPGYRIDFEPCAKRVRTVFNGETLADSSRVRLLRETGHVPVYYFPRADLRADLLVASDHESFCPVKGAASYWHVRAGGRRAENAVWSYERPLEAVARIEGYMAVTWDLMDAWYEEDEEVFVHARDPHVRIDVLASRRLLEVVLGGETLARTTAAQVLFETGLPVRYYIPPADVRLDLLRPSDSRSACPSKGRAGYYAAEIGGRVHEDIAWVYPEPLPEVGRIKDLICFYNEKVDALILDGRTLPKR